VALILVILGALSSRTIADNPKAAGGADAMLKQIEELRPPDFDSNKQSDQAYIASFMEQRKKWAQEKADLEGKFVAAYPDHPKAAAMRLERWRLLANAGQMDKAQAECNDLLKQVGHENDADALFFLAMTSPRGDTDKKEAAIERFIQAAPKDDRGAQLLQGLAQSGVPAEKSKAITERILKDYPDSSTAKMAKGQERRTSEIGKPFELSFTDAISGKSISMGGLKGKVVVVDFWATWCGPCVGEMPNMKELYAKYKPQGVEFIGVSLDQPESDGGLKKLKDFVAKNEIGWPQYYQGKGWESEFSSSWGVNSIPCVFVVDSNGNLASTSARGQLEKLVPDLINKRDNKSADASQ
jgi:thiol-disulfide isomerase/thioredoxin